MPLQDSLLAPRPAWLGSGLRLLALHRFLTARQVALVLALEAAAVTTTFEGLVGEGVLQTLAPTTLSLQRTIGPAFALTRAGVACVGEEGIDARHVVRPLKSSFTLGHELLLNELALVLGQLDDRRKLRLLSWETARERIADVTTLGVKGRPVRVPLVADGLAIVEHRGQRTGLLVEIDMGTVSATSMRQKYAGYHAWWSDGGPTRRFGLSATRILTIAPAPRRLQRLRELAIEAVDGRGSGLFWFLPHQGVDVGAPERLLDAVATIGRGGEDEPCALFSG